MWHFERFGNKTTENNVSSLTEISLELVSMLPSILENVFAKTAFLHHLA